MTGLLLNRPEGLSSKDLKILSRRKSFYWFKDAVLDWSIIIICFITLAYFESPFLFIPMAIIIGNRQHGLSLLGHDGTHYTISYNKKFNDLFTNFLTWIPLGLTLDGYRNLHKLHHRNLGTEGDPEIHHKRSRSPQWDIPNSPIRVMKYALLDMVGYSLPDYYIIVTYSKPSSRSSYVPLFVVHAVFIVTSVFLGLWWIPIVWYGSLCTTFMMFFRLRLWLEHQGTRTTHRLHLNVWQGALFAPHLSWYHWEHHNWPSVPYYSLSGLRALIQGDPIISLGQLIEFYKNSKPVSSGTALREQKLTASDPTEAEDNTLDEISIAA